MLTLDILGSNATAPTALGPASGYVVSVPGGVVLIDAGPGVMAEFLTRYDLTALRAIVVTHLHADHSLDLMAFAYRWTFPKRLDPIPVYVPAEDLARLEAFDAVFGIASLPGMQRPIHDAFTVRGLDLAGTLVTDLVDLGVSIRSFRAHHPVPAASVRLQYREGEREYVVAFSGDTGRCEGVAAAAQGANIFVCEATYLDADSAALDGHGHLTARMAGEVAQNAQAMHLVLSHFALDSMRDLVGNDARETFSGTISVARRGSIFVLGDEAS